MKQCGPDAIRFVFFRHDLTQHDLKIDIIRLADEGLRHCNKLWNMAKYCERVFDSLQQDVNNIAAVKNEELIRILSSDLENENVRIFY
jgi:valyl-tRNA synthetase